MCERAASAAAAVTGVQQVQLSCAESYRRDCRAQAVPSLGTALGRPTLEVSAEGSSGQRGPNSQTTKGTGLLHLSRPPLPAPVEPALCN